MPKGIYVRKQEEVGYKDRAYWSRKKKEQVDFICEKCGVYRPARFLAAIPEGDRLTLGTGEVLCFKCDAEKYFGSKVWSVQELLVKAHEAGIFISEHHLRTWAKGGLLPQAHRGFLPEDFLPKAALLFHNRSLAREVLKDLIEGQKVEMITLENLVTGQAETLVIIEEFPAVSLDGRKYICRRLLDGALLIRSIGEGMKE